MKKNKSKSKKHSTSKQTRKELESKLAVAFNEVVSPYGKSKKADKVIEKFAKLLSKKVSISVKYDSLESFIKEEISVSSIEAPAILTEKKLRSNKSIKDS